MTTGRLDRRAFLAAALAGSALVVSCKKFGKARFPITVHARADTALNAWVVIGADDTVTFLVDESEMGQGVLTALAMVLAEELGADWSRVRAENAICDPSRYGYQGTAASTSMREQEPRLRKVGAAARAMLVQAAADSWGVPVSGLRVERSEVLDPGAGRRVRFGALAASAAKLDPPDDPPLLPVAERWLTGTSPARLDIPAKVRGQATYGLDVRRPGQWFAAVARPPFGETIAGVDDGEARKVAGVRDVLTVPSGVAVLADHTWAALKGRDLLKVTTQRGPDAGLDDQAIDQRLAAGFERLRPVYKAGQGAAALGPLERQTRLELNAPLLAHACLEPLNATAHVTSSGCELWAPTQAPTEAQWAAAEAAGLDDSEVLVHTTLLGGGFGRKGQQDFVQEATWLSAKTKRPVQVVFDRADDLGRGHYRPCARCRGVVSVDQQGRLDALRADLVSAPIFEEEGKDPTGVEGFDPVLYAIPNVEVRWAPCPLPVPVGFWRSVGSSQNAFFLESLIDAAARSAQRDPVDMRLDLLPDRGETGRLRRVVQRVAERSGWGQSLPEGRAHGIAAHACFGTHVAQVAEVSLEKERVRVHRVFCAFDCGPVIHPDNVRAQVEGAIAFGLSAALHQRISFAGGQVQERNFDTFGVLRFSEMPEVIVDLVPSAAALGGVGEPATPPIAPAVAAAVAKLTGRVPEALPLQIAAA